MQTASASSGLAPGGSGFQRNATARRVHVRDPRSRQWRGEGLLIPEARWIAAWADPLLSEKQLKAAKARFEGHPETERHVLSALAVFAGPLPPASIQNLLFDRNPDEVSAALDCLRLEGFVATVPENGSFLVHLAQPRHVTAYYLLTSHLRRSQLHAAAFRLLSVSRGRRSAEEMAEIAWHARFGLPLGRAVEVNLAAAKACQSKGLLPLSAETYAWLAREPRNLTHAQRFETRLGWADTLQALARPLEAAKILRDARNDEYVRAHPVPQATIAIRLASYANASGDHTAGLRLLDRTLESRIPRRARGLCARLRTTRAVALLGLGKIDEAAEEVQHGLRIAPEQALDVQRDLWSLAGMIAFGRKELDAAASAYHEALRIAEGQRSRRGVAELSSNLGAVEARRGRMTYARKLLDRAIRLKRRTGEEMSMAPTLCERGRLLYHTGDLHAARRTLEEAADLAVRAGDGRALAGIQHNLAAVWRSLGDLTRSEEVLQGVRDDAAADGRDADVARAESNLALIAGEMDDLERAYRLLRKAHSGFERIRDAEGLAFCARVEAILAEIAGDSASVLKAVGWGREVASRAHLDLLDAQLSILGASADRRPAGREENLRTLRAAQDLFRIQSYPAGLLEAVRREAWLLLAGGSLGAAKARFRDVRRKAEQAGFALEAVRACRSSTDYFV